MRFFLELAEVSENDWVLPVPYWPIAEVVVAPVAGPVAYVITCAVRWEPSSAAVWSLDCLFTSVQTREGEQCGVSSNAFSYLQVLLVFLSQLLAASMSHTACIDR